MTGFLQRFADREKPGARNPSSPAEPPVGDPFQPSAVRTTRRGPERRGLPFGGEALTPGAAGGISKETTGGAAGRRVPVFGLSPSSLVVSPEDGPPAGGAAPIDPGPRKGFPAQDGNRGTAGPFPPVLGPRGVEGAGHTPRRSVSRKHSSKNGFRKGVLGNGPTGAPWEAFVRPWAPWWEIPAETGFPGKR